ncbi:MAG: PaaI family thioesterase [Thermoleophilaceae bacterium]
MLTFNYDGDSRLVKPSPFDEHYGLQLEECTERSVRGRVLVTPQVTQPMGMVHGGVYAAMAEALASLGTNMGVVDAGMVALGMSNHTTFLRPISEGHVVGHARRRHAGRRSWVWQVEMTDDQGRLCASSTMIVAVRADRRPDVLAPGTAG